MANAAIRRVKLGEVAMISAGQGAPQGVSSYCSEGVPFVKAGNLQELVSGCLEETLQCVNEEVARRHKLKLYKAGSVLFAKSGMSCMKGLVHVLRRDCYVVSHLAVVTPLEHDSARYLEHYFKFHKPNELVKDAAYPSISLADISNIEIAYPPLPEQRRIAGVLDKTGELKRNAEARLQKLDLLVKARFNEMFGDLVDNPFKWKFAPLGEVCDVRDGTHASPKYHEVGYPLMTSKNFSAGIEDFSDVKLISKEDYDEINKRSKVDVGDIVMPMIGTIGHPLIIRSTRPFAIKNVSLIKFGSDELINVFVKAVLDSAYFQKVIEEKNRGNTQKFIALGDIRGLLVPLPPLSLQRAFAAFVEKVEALKAVAQKEIAQVDLLYRAKLQEYFG